MTKLARLVAAAAVLLIVPTVLAHGAEPPREIETRVMADDDGPTGYGACLEGQCVPGSQPEGWDLLVLEAREAALPDGRPVLILRTVYQATAAHEGRAVDIAFTAGGKEHSFSFEEASGTVTSTDLDGVQGPFEAFDGFPRAVDAYMLYSTIGVKPGDKVTGIHVSSRVGDETSDIMPGTWFLGGQEAPGSPDVPGAEHTDPEYTLAGPAKLVTAISPAGRLDTRNATATVTVTNPLANTPQFVNLTASAASGIQVELDTASAKLDPGGTRDITVRLRGATASGEVRVVAVSDLGGFQVVTLQAVADQVLANQTAPGHHATHAPTAQPTATQSHEATGAGVAAIGMALAGAALRRRRA